MSSILATKARKTRRTFFRLSASFGLSALLCAGARSAQSHAQAPSFIVTIGGAYLREKPLLSSRPTQPVFAGDRYAIVARTPNNVWLQLQALETDEAGWLLSAYGKPDGGIEGVSAVGAPAISTKVGPLPLPKWITPVSATAKKLYLAKSANKDLNAFTVIGDCNSVPEAYLGRLATGLFDVSKHPPLTPVVERFASSFSRVSVAAFSGFNSGSMLSPEWANPSLCQPGEGLLACELRRSRASIVFVSLGTGD